MNTILIIEDEAAFAELLAFHLHKDGYSTIITTDGVSGLETARTAAPDLILLDLMLPGVLGTEICKMLKGSDKTSHIPIIMLTAKGGEIDRVVGFEVGADDYMVKPFSFRELLLRIKAVLRRSGRDPGTPELITVGPVTIDMERHIVSINGTEITLTTTEFKLLLNLAERPGRVQSREILLKNVWGFAHIGDTRTVDTHVTRLRTKLGDAGDMIKTVRGFGYKIEKSEA
jgi:two-component system, OmpR family, phosphate regulon response regulator PhoB